MDDGASYEIGLGNVHIPSHQSILVKDDFKRSYIQYNMGMFLYNKSQGRWELLENSHRELWRYAPNVDFEGLDKQTNIQKLDFINRLSESLTLGSHSNVSENALYLFFTYLSRREPNLYVRNILEDYDPKKKDSLWFRTLSALSQDERYIFFESLMKYLSLNPIEYVENVLYTYRNDKRIIDKILTKIKYENNGDLSKLGELFRHDLFTSLWYKQEEKKNILPL